MTAAALLGVIPSLATLIDPTFEVWESLDPVHAARWLAAWLECPDRDVFAHPGYVGLYTTTSARALCARWQGQGVTILYPFLLRDLGVERYAPASPATDVTTPPGYGGPVVWGEGNRAAAGCAFWTEFDTWARHQSVISEFIRFNLFHDPTLGFPGEYDSSRRNVIRDLAPAEESLWADVKPKVRKNVAASRRLGVRIEVDPTGARLDEFMAIYEHTMTRNSAAAGYYYPQAYFEGLIRNLPELFCFFHALHENRVVSTELVLLSGDCVYSFLGGTLEDAFPLRPNDLLKYELILWSKRQGKRWFVLGGGARGEDGVFQYKRSFAPDGLLPFCLGRRVLCPEVYAELVANRRALALREGQVWEPSAEFFPTYRS